MILTVSLQRSPVQFIDALGVVNAVTSIYAKRGDTALFDFVFDNGLGTGAAIEIDPGGSPALTSFKWGAKKQGDLAGDYVVSNWDGSAFAHTKTGTGAGAIYHAALNLDSLELVRLLIAGTIAQTVADQTARYALTGLAVGRIVEQTSPLSWWMVKDAGNLANGAGWTSDVPQLPSTDLACELELVLGGRIISTAITTLHVENDLNRGVEGTPQSANPAYPLPASIVTFDSAGSTVRYLRINADNTLSWLSSADFLAAIGAAAGGGSLRTPVTNLSALLAGGDGDGAWKFGDVILSLDNRHRYFVADVTALGVESSYQDLGQMIFPLCYAQGSADVAGWTFGGGSLFTYENNDGSYIHNVRVSADVTSIETTHGGDLNGVIYLVPDGSTTLSFPSLANLDIHDNAIESVNGLYLLTDIPGVFNLAGNAIANVSCTALTALSGTLNLNQNPVSVQDFGVLATISGTLSVTFVPLLPALTTLTGSIIFGSAASSADVDSFFNALAATVTAGGGTISATSAEGTAPPISSEAARTYLAGLGITIITD